MKHFGQPAYGGAYPGSRVHHAVATQLVNPFVAHGGNRWQRVPCTEIAGACARGIDADFDDDVGRTSNRELARRLNALSCDVREYVRPACRVEHVVQEPDGAARVDPAQRL